MQRHLRCLVVVWGLVLVTAVSLAAQNPAWTRPFPGHRVIGNLYAVGTYDLAVFLITSDDGHILINTGLDDSTSLIRDNIESLGFRLEDVEILLQMQSHWDHTAALAEIKEITGAQMWATEADAPVLEDGGFSDPHFGGRESFTPVSVDKIIREGDLVELGDIRLAVMKTPGHTAGSPATPWWCEKAVATTTWPSRTWAPSTRGNSSSSTPPIPASRTISRRRFASRKRWVSTSGFRPTVPSMHCTTSMRRDRPTARRPSSIRTGFLPQSSVSNKPTWNNSRTNGVDTAFGGTWTVGNCGRSEPTDQIRSFGCKICQQTRIPWTFVSCPGPCCMSITEGQRVSSLVPASGPSSARWLR
ncbi:MAG TPA: metallo-beta-lactamase [Acidobacteria bacterium]|nr:metallo-beta-lactamase [Acidobacteriota bacterium]